MSLVWMWLEKIVGLHSQHIDKHALYTNFFAIPAIIIVVFALLDKRKNYYKGFMSYKQGFITGLLITAIIIVLAPLSQYITLEIITPEYFQNIIKYSVDTGKMTLAEAEKYFCMQNYIIQSLFGAAIMGIITSALVAIFTKRIKKH